MADYNLILPLLASFVLVYLLMPFWIRKAKQIGLLWEDMNKFRKQKVAGSGGIIVLLGFLAGALVFVAYRVFFLHESSFLVEILALSLVITLLSMIGLIDDLLGWRHGGLSRRSRILLVAFSSIPLIAINAGRSIVDIPFLGLVDVGFLYPLILIPLGIVGATTTFNFLAGFNGLEAGQGILLLLSFSTIAFLTGSSWLAILGLCMVLALLAFLRFNWYPAKVFPGDCLTYAVGGLIAIIPILGNFEKLAVFFFIPYILEVILKARGKLVKQSFGLPKRDGSLDLRYEKIYGLEHFAILLLSKAGIKPTEKRVVLSIYIFQLLIIILGFIIFASTNL